MSFTLFVYVNTCVNVYHRTTDDTRTDTGNGYETHRMYFYWLAKLSKQNAWWERSISNIVFSFAQCELSLCNFCAQNVSLILSSDATTSEGS